MSRYLSHLAALTLNRVEPVQPRLASRFETPGDMAAPENNRLDAVQELHAQPSTLTSTDSPVVQKIVTAPVNIQPKQEQNPPKIIEHTEFIINKPESPGDRPKSSPGRGFTSFDTKVVNTEPSNRTAQPVAHASYGIRKDALPTESMHTPVERIQERFTETTHNELIIREVAASDTNQKTSKLEASPRPAPVKPASIVMRPEQSPVEPNTPRQAGTQSVPTATDAAPAPSIQVTIGRIEIRATQVAEKPAVKQRASTTMSLDDYLNQRSGGRA